MNISFITAHFFDFAWVERWVEQIKKYSPDHTIKEFLIVDQDRNVSSYQKLSKLDPRVRVLQYPKSNRHFLATGHDHAAVLNLVVHEAQGDYICIFDSDAHPISITWLDNCLLLLKTYDAVLAQDPISPSLSHPCFMFMRRDCVSTKIRFDEQLFDNHVDTGRLVAKQLIEAKKNVYLASPERKVFEGQWGCVYINSIYHHGNGSFAGGDHRLISQLSWRHKFFRDVVINHRSYSLSFLKHLEYLCRLKLLKINHVLAKLSKE